MMNWLKLVFPLLLFALIISCSSKDTESYNSSIKKAEVLNESSTTKSDGNNEILAEEQVTKFNEWFMNENRPFVKFVDSVSGTISLNEEDEWDGKIPNYNQKKNDILNKAKLSIENSTAFTNAFKKKLIRLISAAKPEDYVLNLPSLLLQNKNAFHLSGIFFDQVYNVEKRQAELGENSRKIDISKRFTPSNSKLVLCNTGYNTVFEEGPIILVFIKEDGDWKISDIFSESDLFE